MHALQQFILTSASVLPPTCLQVLQVLVRMGAPPRILLDGKPHLGTDRLVRMLQQFRTQLKALGVSG